MIAHNGEINTVQGNRNWMRARQSQLESELLGDLRPLFPIVSEGASDSASFDEVVELLTLGGRSLPHAIMMMVPEAWENQVDIDPTRRAFYEFHSMLMEPWDGPAALVFTDGTLVGATLDRNGLRPGRFLVTDDGLVVLASEIGVLDFPPDRIVRKGRLRPGKMFLVDTAEGRIVEDDEIKAELAASAALAGLARRGPHPPRRPSRARAHHAHPGVGGAPPAHLRLHRGGGAHPRHPDGPERRRAARRDGLRHADRGAERPAAPAVRLLHAAVRPGDEPAARLDPRRGRDLDEPRPRTGAQPADGDSRARAADRARLPGDRQRRTREDPALRDPQRPQAGPRHPGPLQDQEGREGAGQAARRDVRRGRRRDRGRRRSSWCSATATPTPISRRSRRC